MSYKIKGDVVIFENEYSGNTVVLKHSKTGGTLEFNSNIKFTFDTEFNNIAIGDYTIEVDNSDNLTIKKNGLSLLKLNS